MVRLRGEGAEPHVKQELADKRKPLVEQIEKLSELLSSLESEKEEEVDLEAAAAEAAAAEAKKAREGGCGETTKMAVGILKNTISGYARKRTSRERSRGAEAGGGELGESSSPYAAEAP